MGSELDRKAGDPMSERETALREALIRVRAHTEWRYPVDGHEGALILTSGLLRHIAGIVDAALASLPPDAAPQTEDVEKWRMAALLKDRTRREIRNRVLLHGESAESISEDYGIPAQFARHLAAFQLAPDVPDASAARQFWLTKHGGLGHAITPGDEFDRCSCGSEFWPAAALPPAAPQTCEWRREGNHVRPGCRPRYAWPVDGEWRACPYCTLPLVLTPAEEPK